MNNHILNRQAFTLVELLVVISIIAMLVALLLPAVQGAREAARVTQCSNQLRQVAVASLTHESAHGFMPSNGWGWSLVGDPNYGFGREQPGGWAFNILPFIDERHVHQIAEGSDNKPADLARMNETIIESYYCPSRREPRTYPLTHAANNAARTRRAARADYAINAGSQTPCVQAGSGRDGWCGAGGVFWRQSMPTNWKPNGISFQRSEVRLAQIVDGTSKTYLAGERYLNPLEYTTGKDLGDNASVYLGHDIDIARWTSYPAARDRAGLVYWWSFGSAHQGGFQMAMCDASVRLVDFQIDREIHEASGNREDQ